MGNREERFMADYVHMFLAFRKDKGEKPRCLRTVIKNHDADLHILKERCKYLGGHWRIHRTVNKRDTAKAMKNLMHTLIDHPEKASHIDTEWRTALLQRNTIYGEKRFMLDVDTEDPKALAEIDKLLSGKIPYWYTVKSPNGWHYMIQPCDTRELTKREDVTLLKDGYVYVCSIGGE